jgi:hypothetical protein
LNTRVFGAGTDDVVEVIEVDTAGAAYVEGPNGTRTWVDVSNLGKAQEVSGRPVPFIRLSTEDVPLGGVENYGEPRDIEISDLASNQIDMMRGGHIDRDDDLSREVNYNGVSQTYVGYLEDGTQVLVKDTDEGGGRRRGANESEVLAYSLAHAAGAEGHATRAVMRKGGTHDGFVVRQWAEGTNFKDLEDNGEMYLHRDHVQETDFEVQGILNAVSGATDMHNKNIILTPNSRVVVIDNDFGFNGLDWYDRYDDSWEAVGEYFETAASRYSDVIYGEGVTFNSFTIRKMVKAVEQDDEFWASLEVLRGWEEVRATEGRIEHLKEYADRLDRDFGGSIVVRY